jgi:hypothetical protein
MFHGHLDYFQKPSLRGRPNTKSLGDHGTPNVHNHWLIYFIFIMCEDPHRIESHWTSTWLRARSCMTSHYTWGSVTTLHDFGGALGRRPQDTSFWTFSQFHGHGLWLVCEVTLHSTLTRKLAVWPTLLGLHWLYYLMWLTIWRCAVLELSKTSHFIFYRSWSNWLFGHYRTPTSLLGKKVHEWGRRYRNT